MYFLDPNARLKREKEEIIRRSFGERSRRELTFHLIGKFSVPGRAIFLLTRRRVFHFARLQNQVKNSSSNSSVRTSLPFLFVRSLIFSRARASGFFVRKTNPTRLVMRDGT